MHDRNLLDTVRSLLFSAHMPKYLRGEVVHAHRLHLIIRLPFNSLQGCIFFEVFSTHVPIYIFIPLMHTLHARILGYVVFVHVLKNQRTKLDVRALNSVSLLGTILNRKSSYELSNQNDIFFLQ